MNKNLDIKKLENWIGKKEIVKDILTPNLEQKFRATLDIKVGDPKIGDIASSGIHWAIAPPITRTSELGTDSHAARGSFLPPVSLPRRMWAGCQTTFFSNFYIRRKLSVKQNVQFFCIMQRETPKKFWIRSRSRESFLIRKFIGGSLCHLRLRVAYLAQHFLPCSKIRKNSALSRANV